MTDEKKVLEAVVKAREIDWYVLFLYGVAAVTGAAGGCALAAALKTKGIDITKYVTLAYAAIGGFCGMVFFVWYVSRGWIDSSLDNAIIYGGGSGIVVILAMMGANITIRFGSKRFIDDMAERFGVDIQMNNPEEKKKKK